MSAPLLRAARRLAYWVLAHMTSSHDARCPCRLCAGADRVGSHVWGEG